MVVSTHYNSLYITDYKEAIIPPPMFKRELQLPERNLVLGGDMID